MKFEPTKIPGVYIISMSPMGDSRGWFARVYCKEEFVVIGHTAEWVQINHSFTQKVGTVRGIHYQKPPYAEIKVVRCIAGRVFDVAVDLRQESPTFLQWVGVELSAAGKNMLYLPQGVAHGFQVLETDSELLYFHSANYTPSHEDGVLYNDQLIDIQWPLPVTGMSSKDLSYDLLSKEFKGIKL